MDPRTRSLTEYMRFRIGEWRDKGLSYEQIGKQKLNSTKVTANDIHKGKRTVGLELANRIAEIHHKGDYNAMFSEAEAWAESPEGRRWLHEQGTYTVRAPQDPEITLRNPDGTVTLVEVKRHTSDDARALGEVMARRLAGAEIARDEWEDFLAALDLACKRLRRNVSPTSPRARSVPPSSRGAADAPPSSKAPGRSRPRMKAGAKVAAKA